jgi:SAM-dependent methyltransferase
VNPKRLVAEGYDRIAEGYLRQRTRTPKEHISAYLDRVTEGLDGGGRVLDLGCGAGVPYAAYLSQRFDVIGVDISRRQLALARRLVPKASFLLADMCSLAFKPASFDAIVALYSIIHVPREEHEALLRRLHEFLRPGGRLLAVLGAGSWEGRESDWLVPGVEMYWSHFDADTNLKIIEQAGFCVLLSNIEPDPLDGAHLFVLAEKPA